eukprot:901203-Alexandrium_andersonii.AAC.1
MQSQAHANTRTGTRTPTVPCRGLEYCTLGEWLHIARRRPAAVPPQDGGSDGPPKMQRGRVAAG